MKPVRSLPQVIEMLLVHAGESSWRLGLATPNPYSRGMALPCPALKTSKNLGQAVLVDGCRSRCYACFLCLEFWRQIMR